MFKLEEEIIGGFNVVSVTPYWRVGKGGVKAGDVVSVDDSGRIIVNSALSTDTVVGFSLKDSIEAYFTYIAPLGVLSGFVGLIPGKPVFASLAKPGGVQQTLPCEAGFLTRLGVALSDTTILIRIENIGKRV